MSNIELTEEEKLQLKQKRMEEYEKRKENKLERAKHEDTRVINTKSLDTDKMLNIMEQADSAIIRVRKEMGDKVSYDVTKKYITEFNILLTLVHFFTKKLCRELNTKYYDSKRVLNAIELTLNEYGLTIEDIRYKRINYDKIVEAVLKDAVK